MLSGLYAQSSAGVLGAWAASGAGARRLRSSASVGVEKGGSGAQGGYCSGMTHSRACAPAATTRRPQALNPARRAPSLPHTGYSLPLGGFLFSRPKGRT